MPNQNLKPYRDYDPHEVITNFAYDGSSADKGLVVKVTGNGWKNTDTDMQYNAVGASYTNTQSLRMSIPARVTAAGSGDVPLGMLLTSVSDTDNHGDRYLRNRAKQKANDVALSGEAVEVLKRGLVLYSGVWGTPTAGQKLYTAAGGAISTSGTNVIGTALGTKDSDNFVLINLQMS